MAPLAGFVDVLDFRWPWPGRLRRRPIVGDLSVYVDARLGWQRWLATSDSFSFNFTGFGFLFHLSEWISTAASCFRGALRMQWGTSRKAYNVGRRFSEFHQCFGFMFHLYKWTSMRRPVIGYLFGCSEARLGRLVTSEVRIVVKDIFRCTEVRLGRLAAFFEID